MRDESTNRSKSHDESAEGIIKRPKTLAIMPTYQCPAACNDCASLSSPRVRTRLSFEIVHSAITEANELDFHNVVFTGGEATLKWKELLAAISLADSYGFPTRLVTNAHWAQSHEIACNRLDELLDSGLTEINYSTGDEHVRFIPVQRVAYAVLAALSRNIPVSVMIETRGDRRVSRETFLDLSELDALDSQEIEELNIIESPWMPLDPFTVESYPEGMAVDRDNLSQRTGCDNVLQTYTVQADGKIGACCGIGMRLIPELTVGNTEESGFLERAIEDAENDFLKLWIHYEGPERILAWASEKDPRIEWEGMYAHRCQACARIYKDPTVRDVIREHYEEVVADVLRAAWFSEFDIPASKNI